MVVDLSIGQVWLYHNVDESLLVLLIVLIYDFSLIIGEDADNTSLSSEFIVNTSAICFAFIWHLSKFDLGVGLTVSVED